VDDNDQAVWDMYFSALAGWSMHPGYYRENATKPTLVECAHIADEMMKIRRERINMRPLSDG